MPKSRGETTVVSAAISLVPEKIKKLYFVTKRYGEGEYRREGDVWKWGITTAKTAKKRNGSYVDVHRFVETENARQIERCVCSAVQAASHHNGSSTEEEIDQEFPFDLLLEIVDYYLDWMGEMSPQEAKDIAYYEHETLMYCFNHVRWDLKAEKISVENKNLFDDVKALRSTPLIPQWKGIMIPQFRQWRDAYQKAISEHPQLKEAVPMW